jgi:hypothetical protein
MRLFCYKPSSFLDNSECYCLQKQFGFYLKNPLFKIRSAYSHLPSGGAAEWKKS